MTLRRVVATTLCACVGLALAASPAFADGKKGKGVIKGTCKFEGAKPPVKAIDFKADPNCHTMHPKAQPVQETIVYNYDDKTKTGDLPYVFVYVKEGISDKYDVPTEPVTIDQKGCMYHPHVFGMIAGQALEIKNSDNTAHNIHAMPKKNTEFNIGQPKPMKTTRKDKETFTREEVVVKFKCDVHPWMSAYVGVLTHPFFGVSKDDPKAERGKYEIKDLPAGDYVLEAWHEKWGKQTQKVTLKDGETKEVNFTFKKESAMGMNDAGDGKIILASEATGGSCCASKKPAAQAVAAADGKKKPEAVPAK